MIEILIGNIASGKSTYCRQKAKDGFIIVNDDSIVNAVHCNDYTLYDESLKPLYKSIENQIALTSIALGRNVIIDRGLNLTPHSRRRWVGLAHSLDVPCHAIIFPFEKPEIHAGRREKDNMRGHDYDYWLAVATTFNNKYVKPQSSEQFDAVVNAAIDIL